MELWKAIVNYRRQHWARWTSGLVGVHSGKGPESDIPSCQRPIGSIPVSFLATGKHCALGGGGPWQLIIAITDGFKLDLSS